MGEVNQQTAVSVAGTVRTTVDVLAMLTMRIVHDESRQLLHGVWGGVYGA